MVSKLGELQKERFESVYRSDVRELRPREENRGAEAEFWSDSGETHFRVWAWNLFEANVNMARSGLISHNLYLEVWQELGIIGLGIYVCFLVSILKVYFRVRKNMKNLHGGFDFWRGCSIL